MIGETAVGKTSIFRRLIHQQFTENFEPTVGGDLGKHVVKVEDKTLNLQVWDTSGMECYRSVSRTFYRGSHAVVLAYSLIDS
jgi:small GTP-binding protein